MIALRRILRRAQRERTLQFVCVSKPLTSSLEKGKLEETTYFWNGRLSQEQLRTPAMSISLRFCLSPSLALVAFKTGSVVETETNREVEEVVS